MTGEKVTPATSVRYVDDITSGDIPLMIAGNATRYWVSPAFIIKHNTGADGTALFYGGFCYSNLGHVATGDHRDRDLANTYTGFSWSVYTEWNATWAANLYWYLADTSQSDGMTVAGWHDGTTSMAKSYYNTEQNRWVEIRYAGGQFALWRALKITSLSPVSGPVGTAVTISGTGFGATRGQRTVTLNAGALTPSSWSDTQIGVTIPPVRSAAILSCMMEGEQYSRILHCDRCDGGHGGHCVPARNKDRYHHSECTLHVLRLNDGDAGFVGSVVC